MGEEFVERTFKQTVLDNNTAIFYIKDCFAIACYGSDRFETGGVIGRIYNSLVKAINDWIIFPQYIVVIVDSDFTKKFKLKYQQEEILARYLNVTLTKLFTEIDQLIKDHKEELPDKAQKQKYPLMMWLIPPLHSNFSDVEQRNITGKVIKRLCFKFPNMRFGKLRSWEEQNLNLVMEREQGCYRFTSRGLKQYWSAVDAAVREVDEKVSNQPNIAVINRRQHWHRQIEMTKPTFGKFKRQY